MRRGAPNLSARRNFKSLLYRPEPQVEDGRIFECRRTNRRPAFSAKRLPAFCAAVCNFHIDFGVAVQQAEILDFRRDAGSKRRPGETLAVGTMTDRCHLWLDVCRVSDRATMASGVDLHEKPHAPRRAGHGHAPSSTTISSGAGWSARLPTSGWPRPRSIVLREETSGWRQERPFGDERESSGSRRWRPAARINLPRALAFLCALTRGRSTLRLLVWLPDQQRFLRTD